MPNEAELPVLQNDEYLPSVSRWMTWGGVGLSATLGGVLILAAVTRYNVTVEAPASLRPAADLGVVQASAEGTVSRVNVQPNQVVHKGDVIAEINVQERSNLRSLEARQNTLQSYIQKYNGQLAQVNEQLRTLEGKILAQAKVPKSDQTTTPVGTEQPASSENLVNGALEALAESNPKVAKELSSQRNALLKKQLGLQNQIQYDQEALGEVSTALGRQIVRAPIDGTILKLNLHNPGQPVRLGDEVVQIVPQDGALVAKARVAVQDISKVSVGQMAQLRITAYPYPDYGVLTGTVQAIAPDVTTSTDGTTPTLPFYEVTIQPAAAALTRDRRQYPIQPGMEATADIISRQETLLQFLLRKARLWSGV
jgi:HlyD family secretion protein